MMTRVVINVLYFRTKSLVTGILERFPKGVRLLLGPLLKRSRTPFGGYADYRAYLVKALPTQGKDRGARVRLADYLGIQKGFVSAVLGGNAHFSLEQAFRVSRFLSHTEAEHEFFLLLVQKDRAGSKELEKHFKAKIAEILQRRREIQERVQTKATLSETDQLKYYSSWHYTAVHMCLMIPELRTPAAMARYLGLPLEIVAKTLEFFVSIGVAKPEGGEYVAGPTRIHISRNSPFILQHHTNWRVQAIRSLDRATDKDLHYSLVMSVSAQAVEKIREIFLNAIQSSEPVMQEAKDEGVYVLNLDLFQAGR